MKAFRFTIAFFIVASSSSLGQTISKTDSTKIIESAYKILDVLDKGNRNEFLRSSTSVVYCSPCIDLSDTSSTPEISSEIFYKKYLPKIVKYDWYKKIKSHKTVFFDTHTYNLPDLIVFFNIWLKDPPKYEYDQMSIGVHLQKDGKEYKFAGIETVP